MRQVFAVAAGAALAGLGAVVLGEYDLRGATAFVGFPLYALAVTELALAVSRRLAPLALVALTAVVGAGLTWALWISFGHFRNDFLPPWSSWAMVAVAAAATAAWGRSGHRRGSPVPEEHPEREALAPSGPSEQELQSPGPQPPASPESAGRSHRDEEAHP